MFQTFRLVCKTTNIKITSALFSMYLDVVTAKIHGVSEISDVIVESCLKAPVIVADGLGNLGPWESRVERPLEKELMTWGGNTNTHSTGTNTHSAWSLMLLEEASIHLSSKAYNSLFRTGASKGLFGLAVMILDPDWHEQTLHAKNEIFFVTEDAIFEASGGRAGTKWEGKMSEETMRHYAKQRSHLCHLFRNNTPAGATFSLFSVCSALLTAEKRLLYDNLKELIADWRSHGDLHIRKSLRKVSCLQEALFGLICTVMESTKQIEDYLMTSDPDFQEKVEILEKEGHRQARTHLEHHKVTNMISLLAKKPSAMKSFARWWGKFVAKAEKKRKETERRMHLYSSGGDSSIM